MKFIESYPCMYQQDYGMDGFEWLVVDDSKQKCFLQLKEKADGSSLIAVIILENKRRDMVQLINR